MDLSEGDIPIKGKRYNLRARPWDNSYMEIKENPNGQWVFDPITTCSKQEGGFDAGYYRHKRIKIRRVTIEGRIRFLPA